MMAAEDVHFRPFLPSYPEMIMAAITALDEKNGSNKTTIAKYIESQHGNLPPSHTTLLSHHLNMMKNSGELVFFKNNYMKADPNAPPRRGRGRPPKDPNAPPKPLKPKPPSATAGSGRPRGRPRKTPKTMDETDGMNGSFTTTATAVKMATGSGRPRGRPPKVEPQVSVQH